MLALHVFAVSGVSNSVSAASVQMVTPPHLRGQASAFYILIASITGIGLGPALVAAITQFGFGDEADLRYSMAIVYAVTLTAAAIVFTLGMRRYRSSVIDHSEPTRNDRTSSAGHADEGIGGLTMESGRSGAEPRRGNLR